MTLIFHFC